MTNPPLWTARCWDQLVADAKRGKSIWLMAPRGFGKEQAALALMAIAEEERQATAALVDGSILRPRRPTPWAAVWSSVSRVLESDLSSLDVTSQSSFIGALLESLRAQNGAKLLVGLLGACHEAVEPFFDVADAFHAALSMLRFAPVPDETSLQCIIADELALWYQHQLTSGLGGRSVWKLFSRHFVEHATEENLAGSRTPAGKPLTAGMRKALLDVTGGHIGLAADVLTNSPAWIWRRHARRRATTHHLMTVLPPLEMARLITRPLSVNATLLEEAARFVEPSYFDDYERPAAQRLRQLGIVRLSGAKAQLAGEFLRSAVADMLDARSQGGAQKRKVSSDVTVAVKERPDVVGILHISDPHFGADHCWRMPNTVLPLDMAATTMAKAIGRDLKASGLAELVDLVVATGDITDTADKSEFEAAEVVLADLLERLGIGRDRVLIVPGNHDVSIDGGTSGEKVNVAGGSSRRFDEFVRELRNGRAGPVRASSPSGLVTVECVPLDSCFIVGRESLELGYVSPEELSLVSELLSTNEVTHEHENVTHRICCLHHHLAPVVRQHAASALSGKKPTLLLNASEVLTWASESGFVGAIHGHHHYPCVSTFQRWAGGPAPPSRALVIAGAGSCGVTRRRLAAFSSNHFFLHVLGRRDWTVFSRAVDTQGIGFVGHKQLSVSIDRSRFE